MNLAKDIIMWVKKANAPLIICVVITQADTHTHTHTHTHTVVFDAQVRQALGSLVTEQSSFLTIQPAIIHWSHIKIPTEICGDEGAEVSEIYSNASIPFSFEYWSCECNTGLAILMGVLISTDLIGLCAHWKDIKCIKMIKNQSAITLNINFLFKKNCYYCRTSIKLKNRAPTYR